MNLQTIHQRTVTATCLMDPNEGGWRGGSGRAGWGCDRLGITDVEEQYVEQSLSGTFEAQFFSCDLRKEDHV